MDVGTGDGHAVLREARRDPETLVVGVDPVASAMATAARRAVAKPSRGGCSNAVFVVSAVEGLTLEVAGLADCVTVNFPWRSLLQGVLGRNRRVLTALAALPAPPGLVEVLLSATERDRIDLPDEADLRASYQAAGLDVLEYRLSTDDEIAASGSSWARRLGAGQRRPVCASHRQTLGRASHEFRPFSHLKAGLE